MEKPLSTSTGTLTLRDPKLWDEGCRYDTVRNSVIIPDLRRRIVAASAQQCCDIGAGTGYVTRALARCEELSKAGWTLLENDVQMINFSRNAVKAEGLSSRVSVKEFDIKDPPGGFLEKFDLAFCCFSTLEFGMSRSIARNMVSVLVKGGTLLIYIPDLLEEVAQTVQKMGNVEPLERYKDNAIEVQKPDRFTGNFEPFFAYRIERLISDFLDGAAVCTCLNFLDRGDGRKIIVIEIAKRLA